MNIIYKEPYRKSYYTTIQQVTKHNGICSDSSGCVECSYWIQDKKHSKCKLFTDFKYKNKALYVCNVIYGLDYTGNP
jgi:hypothetical protein